MIVGIAIASSQLHGLLALALIGAAHWRKIRMEERILQATLGAEYQTYCNCSWALMPYAF
jgi:protein-S-isoprenylcysteine O-methyltransferase Ste14